MLRHHFYDTVYLLAMFGTEVSSEMTLFRENHKKLEQGIELFENKPALALGMTEGIALTPELNLTSLFLQIHGPSAVSAVSSWEGSPEPLLVPAQWGGESGCAETYGLLHLLCVLLQVHFFDKCSLHKLTCPMSNRSNVVFFLGYLIC